MPPPTCCTSSSSGVSPSASPRTAARSARSPTRGPSRSDDMTPPSRDPVPGLEWPSHDSGPTPPTEGRVRHDETQTRKPLGWWDRVKFLVLLAVVWNLFLWATVVDNPIIPFGDAVNDTLRTKWWLVALAGLELLRQIHYLIAERSSAYHRFWAEKVFGGMDRKTSKVNDWTRYRLSRVTRYVVLLALLSIIVGAIRHTSPLTALFELPKTIWSALPLGGLRRSRRGAGAAPPPLQRRGRAARRVPAGAPRDRPADADARRVQRPGVQHVPRPPGLHGRASGARLPHSPAQHCAQRR